MTKTKKLMLKTIASILLILLALPVVFKLLGLLWDAIVYTFQLYAKYIDLYFNNIELSTGIAAAILAFLFLALLSALLAFCDHQ